MDFHKKIISLRASIPALDYGDCDYTSINSSDEMVFTCLRNERRNYAIPVINFREKNTTTFLSLPFEKINLKTGKSYVLHDTYNNENIEFCVERDKKIKLNLAGYGIRVLVLKLTNKE